MPDPIDDLLSDLICDFAQVAKRDLDADVSLEHDMGLDSLSRVELLTVVEQRFSLSVADDLVADLRTVGDLAQVIAASGSTT